MYMKNMKRRNGKYIQREGEDETGIHKKVLNSGAACITCKVNYCQCQPECPRQVRYHLNS